MQTFSTPQMAPIQRPLYCRRTPQRHLQPWNPSKSHLMPFFVSNSQFQYEFLRTKKKDGDGPEQKMWNASRFCVSSLRRGHANLLCIVPILVYVLPKQVHPEREIYLICWSHFHISVSRTFGTVYIVLARTPSIVPIQNILTKPCLLLSWIWKAL